MFFKLTANGWIELYTKLTKSELGLLYYIRSLDPFGDREIEISTSEISKQLQISVRTVQRALASLKDKGLIVSKYVRTRVGGSKVPPSNDLVMEATSTDTSATQRDINTTQNVVEATPMSHSRSKSQTQQAIQKPETNKTKNKKEDSLSERVEKLPQEEREKFLTFAFEEIGKLPNPPCFPKKLIASTFDELYSRFKKSSAPVVQQAAKDKQFAEWYDLMRQLGHVTGQRIENGVQLVHMFGGGWIEYERKAKSWTLEYLRKCVAGR
ncbi:MAG: helix-turn-helix domain-containing protein [Cyanobacteria bacterium P01_G01_bin.49]